MGHTNSTTYYGLPQFLTSDKPAWLTDINNAMADIDAGLHTAQADATTAGNNATQAISDASAASTAASAADAKGAGACASIEASFDSTAVYAVGAKVMYNSLLYRCTVAVTTPGPWTGSANWERITVNSLIPVDASVLPLGSTTPAGSTAEAIANKASKTWTYIDKINLNGTCDVSGYSEVLIILFVNNNRNRESFVYPISELSDDTELHSIIVNSSASVTNFAIATVKVTSNTLAYTSRSLVGWNGLYLKIYAR